jgi:hypothetical protein
MRTRTSNRAIALLTVLGVSAATAQERDDTPETYPNFSCQSWRAEARSGDPATMAALSGVWRGQARVQLPGFAPTTETVTRTRYPDGGLLYEGVECLQPIPQPGMPALRGGCYTKTGRGRWFARAAGNGWIFYAELTQGSGYGGNRTGINCANGIVRMIDENTVESQDGRVGARIGNVQ